MKASARWAVTLLTLSLLVALGAFAATAGEDSQSSPTTEPPTTTTFSPSTDLPDGQLVGWVAVDPAHPGVLVVDEVEILTGVAAHDAAVDAGIISEDEDLPNDMYIANTDDETVAMHLAAAARVALYAAETPDEFVEVTFDDLVAVGDGSYDGTPVYGVVPGAPILMDVTISGGAATVATAVYLP